MKAFGKFIVLFLVLVTIPWALNTAVIDALNLAQLQEPWLFTIQVMLWVFWISVQLMLLGTFGIVKHTAKKTRYNS